LKLCDNPANGAGPFRLKRYPRARHALRSELRAPLFVE